MNGFMVTTDGTHVEVSDLLTPQDKEDLRLIVNRIGDRVSREASSIPAAAITPIAISLVTTFLDAVQKDISDAHGIEIRTIPAPPSTDTKQ